MTKKKPKPPVDLDNYATGEQFKTVLLRWMPTWASESPEGRLIAAIMAQSWSDGNSWFFAPHSDSLQFYCDKLHLDPVFIGEMYRKHSRANARRGLAQ